MSDSKSKFKFIYGTILAAVVLAAISIVAVFPYRMSKTLSISFVGLTNSEFFGPVSAFCASNTCDRGLFILFYSPQSKIRGGWSKPEEQFLDIDGYVEPHKSVQFVVPTVTNQMPWRVTTEWHYKIEPKTNTLWSTIEDKLPANWWQFLKIKKTNLSEDTTGPVYDSYSQVMTNN